MTDHKETKDMLGRGGLISVSRAQQLLRENLRAPVASSEEVLLAEALDRVLATDVVAPENLPAAPRSTMDGFAVRAADTYGASESMPCYLSVTGEVLMGKPCEGDVNVGCCHKVPTGGLIPAGADSVVMFEHTVPVDETMIEVVKGVGTGTNLIQSGEDIRKDAKALPAGHRIRPQDLGLLAGLGIDRVKVVAPVRVGILSTGDEIIPHTQVPKPGQIRNINSIALAGAVTRAHGIYTDYGIVSDRKEIFLPAVEKAIAENDIVLFSGGSSVGVRDLGQQVVEEVGPPGILVHGVTLKPGKPVLIGMSGATPVFGLPGHPVSAMVCFDLFVQPTIAALSGLPPEYGLPRPSITARLTRNINSAPGRLDVVRVQLQQTDSKTWKAEPVLGKSGSISTLSRAHGYFLIDEASQGVQENSTIKVFLYI
ncbi:molybdopterin molybdotransferase MoeA [Desulforhopalus singaporensis]|uniref:Molybdopterin molybdenumtransferase n=1 Tax=Desulforhopalus singaporensis TaxID=91360 RepID=A0A1H0U6Y3_9BACT|nr:gephyrin-like molybdotransferase Glp [Desulforhopalus singaporensis]SDP61820.1 molybdopterin molybdochelatase [Desulforhopalus singaporensis]